MQESDLKEFEDLWTTSRDGCVLVDNREQTYANGQKRGFSIFQLRQGQLVYVLIEDNELAKTVAQRMFEAGVQVVYSSKEALALARSRGDRADTVAGIAPRNSS